MSRRQQKFIFKQSKLNSDSLNEEDKCQSLENGPNNNNNNNNINNNLDKNKMDILKSLILLYANEKEINKISSVPYNCELSNYYPINKRWLDNFKEIFYYNKIYNIFSEPKKFTFISYNDYLNNLDSILLFNEIKDFVKLIREMPLTLSQEIRFLSKEEFFSQNTNFKYPINFELVHVSLFNMLKKFTININDNIIQYKILYSNWNFYLKPVNIPSIFYVYEIGRNERYSPLAVIKLSVDILFRVEFNKYLSKKNFREYIKEKKFDINKINQNQIIFNSNNQKIGDVILVKQLNEIKKMISIFQEDKRIINNNRINNTNIYNRYNELLFNFNLMKRDNIKLIKELNEEKEKVNELNNKIVLLQDYKDRKSTKLLEFKKLIEKQNKELEELKNNNNNDNNDNNNDNLLKTINANENIIAINFTSMDQQLRYCIPCKNTDLFVRIEEILYNEYPEYKDYDTYFIANGNKVKRFKNMDENGIKSGDNIILYYEREK